MGVLMSDGPDKVEDLLAEVESHIADGTYVYTQHAQERMYERGVTDPDVVYALKRGWWEKRKDRRSDHGDGWSYAIRGTTVENRRLRVIVGLSDDRLAIVTVIDIDN